MTLTRKVKCEERCELVHVWSNAFDAYLAGAQLERCMDRLGRELLKAKQRRRFSELNDVIARWRMKPTRWATCSYVKLAVGASARLRRAGDRPSETDHEEMTTHQLNLRSRIVP
ncbi:hypothetical protein GCM10023334_087200 [Nonomuraea thailandensis]